MKDSDFYKRAAADAAFRKKKLDDLRYFKSVGVGLMWFCATVAVGFSLYGGITEGRWLPGDGMLVVAILTATTHAVLKTRIAALEALDEKKA